MEEQQTTRQPSMTIARAHGAAPPTAVAVRRLWCEIGPLRAGDLEAAHSIEADRVDPALERLDEAIEHEVAHNEGEAERALQALGCETAQGFYFARPRAAADITPLLGAGTVDPEEGDAAARFAPSRPRVLVVDDGPEIRASSA